MKRNIIVKGRIDTKEISAVAHWYATQDMTLENDNMSEYINDMLLHQQYDDVISKCDNNANSMCLEPDTDLSIDDYYDTVRKWERSRSLRDDVKTKKYLR